MTSARLMALVAALLVATAPMVAAGQGVPIPQPAPKNRNQPAARPPQAAAPAPMQTDAAGRPIPVRPPTESAPYDGSQRAVVDKISSYLTSLQTLIGDFVQIGYNRAASLIERMEKEGVVGQPNHAGKREILVGGDDNEDY